MTVENGRIRSIEGEVEGSLPTSGPSVIDGEGGPRVVAEARDLIQIEDFGALEAAVDDALAAHADEPARLRDGDQKLVGFFVGQVMRATGGKADPRKVTDLIRQKAAG